jgi:hypothetical protein
LVPPPLPPQKQYAYPERVIVNHRKTGLPIGPYVRSGTLKIGPQATGTTV